MMDMEEEYERQKEIRDMTSIILPCTEIYSFRFEFNKPKGRCQKINSSVCARTNAFFFFLPWSNIIMAGISNVFLTMFWFVAWSYFINVQGQLLYTPPHFFWFFFFFLSLHAHNLYIGHMYRLWSIFFFLIMLLLSKERRIINGDIVNFTDLSLYGVFGVISVKAREDDALGPK